MVYVAVATLNAEVEREATRRRPTRRRSSLNSLWGPRNRGGDFSESSSDSRLIRDFMMD
jgi:hypothetical protein